VSGAPELLSLVAPVEAEIEVKRSRFLARLEPVLDETSARAVVDSARKRHWDARHHCSAFVLGVEGAPGRAGESGVIQRSSDDGEPAGTAGAPILEVLTGRGLTDVVAVVTRWFGGTLLGTGGLIRAYGDAVREACEAARPVRYRLLDRVEVDVPAADVGRVENELRSRGVSVASTDYGVLATLHLDVDPTALAEVGALLAQVTGGAADPRRVGASWSRVG